MKKYFAFYFNSIKQSVLNKPSALVLLILVFFSITLFSSIPIRLSVSNIAGYYESPSYINLKHEKTSFMENYKKIGDYVLENSERMTHKNKESIKAVLSFNGFDYTILCNNKSLPLDTVSFDLAIVFNDYFTVEDFNAKVKPI